MLWLMIRVLATPDLLDGKINLVNALPIAGFLTRSDEDSHDSRSEYTRCARISVKSGERDRVLSILKEGVSALSPILEIRSFLVFQPLDEVDTVYIWERYASPAAFSEMEKGSNYSKVMDEIKSLVEVVEVTGYRVAGGYLSK
jgi:quinol monooxygenase YgiN